MSRLPNANPGNHRIGWVLRSGPWRLHAEYSDTDKSALRQCGSLSSPRTVPSKGTTWVLNMLRIASTLSTQHDTRVALIWSSIPRQLILLLIDKNSNMWETLTNFAHTLFIRWKMYEPHAMLAGICFCLITTEKLDKNNRCLRIEWITSNLKCLKKMH